MRDAVIVSAAPAEPDDDGHRTVLAVVDACSSRMQLTVDEPR